MRVDFRIAPDLNLSVESDYTSRVVNFTTVRGFCGEHANPDEQCQRCMEKTASKVSMPKNEARAIASAMMGCAAEL